MQRPGWVSGASSITANADSNGTKLQRARETIPEADGGHCFPIPADIVKHKEDKLVVVNDVAESVIDAQRGSHAKSP